MFELISHFQYSHPTLYVIVKHWPMTVFVPIVLLLIGTLSFVTRAWDQRELRQVTGVPHQGG